MEEEEKNLTPSGADAPEGETEKTKRNPKIGLRIAIPALCLLLVASILLTWTFTSLAAQKKRLSELDSQKRYYENLIAENQTPTGNAFEILDAMIRSFSLYADNLDEKAMTEAAFKAYVEATGDVYARYYTEEEYAELTAESDGDFCGIGVTVVQSTFTDNGDEKKVYRVIEVYEGSSAIEAGIRTGDLVYAVKIEGAWKTIGELGFDKTLLAMRGKEGTDVEVRFLRESGESVESLERTLTRRKLKTHSVRSELSETDATVGIVHITGFDMTTPVQFKDNVNALLTKGVKHFVFDVRNNPGGDLQSIVAVLSYFLSEGDMVISAIDKDENVAGTYTVTEHTFEGRYAGCSVAKDEIGMYKDLDFTVLCNENTASAAEVFVATLRDYREEKGFRKDNIVGTTTFGKGIMQTTRRIPFTDGTVAYLKLTTHAYVTKCGESYHGEGIKPDHLVELSEDAKKQPLSALKQSDDAQLLAAVALFKNK